MHRENIFHPSYIWSRYAFGNRTAFFIPKGFIHPLVAIVADIVLVLTGGVIQYGLMKLFYKFPLSKAAFGAAAKRGMNA